MLLLWMLPGIPVLILLRNQVRSLLELSAHDRVAAPPEPASTIWTEVAGPVAALALLACWPLALLFRARIAEWLAERPYTLLRWAVPR